MTDTTSYRLPATSRSLIFVSGKIFVILFFLWHTFAVAVYSVPREVKDPVGLWIKNTLLPRVSPYMLITSQWQLWNIFAPDPLRRVTFYRVDAMDSGVWKELTVIQPGTYSVWRHATRFKMMLNMLGEFAENREPLARRFVELQCAEHGLQPTTPIRLRYTYYVIPLHVQRATRAWWEQWRPKPVTYEKFATTCPFPL